MFPWERAQAVVGTFPASGQALAQVTWEPAAPELRAWPAAALTSVQTPPPPCPLLPFKGR